MSYESVIKAAWASDPDFVELCKAMYGPAATVEDLLRAESVAKMGPTASDVHVPGGDRKKKKKLPTLDDAQIAGRAVRKAARTTGFERSYKRDDKGRFSSTTSVAVDSVTSGVAGGGAGYAFSRSGSNLADAFRTLRSTPKGRRALLRALQSAAKSGGKGIGIATLGGLSGAMAAHHGKQAYNEVLDRRSLESQHTKDVKRATTQLDFEEIAGGEATNARVKTRSGDKVASTLIRRKGATAYREFGKKSEPTAVDMGGEITEIDNDKRQVFGWASITKIAGKPVVDLQGDFIDDDELERAAYDYVHKSRVGGAMHWRVDDDGNVISKNRPYHAADLIESVVFTDDKIEKMGISSDRTGWWVGFQVNDPEVWSKVKSGDWKGFSIHGSGRRTPTSLEDLTINTTELGEA